MYIYVVAEVQLRGEDINIFYFNSEEEAKSVFEKIKLLDNGNYVLKKIKVSESKKIISQIVVKAWIYRDRADYHSYFFVDFDNCFMQNFYTLGLNSYIYNREGEEGSDDEGEECCHLHIAYIFHLDDVDIKHKKYARKIKQYIENIIKEEGYESFFNNTKKEIKEKLNGIKLE